MGKTTPAMEAGDQLARTLIPIIKKVASAISTEDESSFLLGFVAHLFGFLAARYGVQTTLELLDTLRPIIERMRNKQEGVRTRH